MARPRSDVFQRFESKVKVLESGCHEWQSVIKRDGYGRFHHNGSGQGAHRVAYQLYRGEIPKGAVVMHSCDNRICVNPAHLSIGTPQSNVSDMDTKRRRGTKSKLTYAQVERIKFMLECRYSQQLIAEKFGIDQTTVSRIKLGKTTLFKSSKE